MSRLFGADFYCETDGRFYEIIEKSERGTPRPCPKCGAPSPEVPGAPRVMNASMPDGTKRPGFEDLKKANEIELSIIDRAPHDPERRAGEAEIAARLTPKPN
jgi:hypothetical protein